MKHSPAIEGPLLRDVCSEFADVLIKECAVIGRSDLAGDLVRVVLPPQLIAGSAEAYSFMAYPVPRLTYEERQHLEVREFELIRISLRAGQVELELDCFGKIGWFYVKELPEYFEGIKAGAEQHAL